MMSGTGSPREWSTEGRGDCQTSSLSSSPPAVGSARAPAAAARVVRPSGLGFSSGFGMIVREDGRGRVVRDVVKAALQVVVGAVE